MKQVRQQVRDKLSFGSRFFFLVMQIRKYVFTASITAISRMMVVRDLLLARIGPLRKLRGGHRHFAEAVVTPCRIASGNNSLNACFVQPAVSSVRAVVLICHGIGETVEHWQAVQKLFASEGVASLVFDYSGYGRSTGWVSGPQCERDAIAAFTYLQGLMPDYPVALLGYSMGSGIAAAVIQRVSAHRLILCAAFTSFRAAAQSLGFPRFLTLTLPHLWRADENLRGYKTPVLIVHGERDELFPVAMAEELASFCDSELVVVPEMTHNEPFYRPDIAYWGLILSRLTAEATGESASVDWVLDCPAGTEIEDRSSRDR